MERAFLFGELREESTGDNLNAAIRKEMPPKHPRKWYSYQQNQLKLLGLGGMGIVGAGLVFTLWSHLTKDELGPRQRQQLRATHAAAGFRQGSTLNFTPEAIEDYTQRFWQLSLPQLQQKLLELDQAILDNANDSNLRHEYRQLRTKVQEVIRLKEIQAYEERFANQEAARIRYPPPP